MAKKQVQDPIGEFAAKCCKEDDIIACKTSKEVFKIINDFLQKKYEGKAAESYIRSIADDVTESICLKLNIKMNDR